MQVRVQSEEKFGACGCGRSPTGKCIGWHSLSESMYQHQKMLWLEEELKRDQELAEYKKQAQKLWNDSCTAGRSE
jgi:hypothetical protein